MAVPHNYCKCLPSHQIAPNAIATATHLRSFFVQGSMSCWKSMFRGQSRRIHAALAQHLDTELVEVPLRRTPRSISLAKDPRPKAMSSLLTGMSSPRTCDACSVC
ncbi:hypothetical protein IG631_24253 [Alternaria alternata]|nr:hypothetical protein IG631_24253 [Alternaria alternata]